jgi:peroxiredoxin
VKLTVLVAAALLAVNPLVAGDTASRNRPNPQDASTPGDLSRRGVEPAPTPVVAGSQAPNFSYQTPDNSWRTLNDLLEQGAVLLVFGARDVHLDEIERERESLLAIGVIPVAVYDGSPRAVRSAIKRLDLKYTVIPDSRGVVAGQFNVLHPTTHAPMRCWFVVDRSGTVRGLDRNGLPKGGFSTIAADALGLPVPGGTLPTKK